VKRERRDRACRVIAVEIILECVKGVRAAKNVILGDRKEAELLLRFRVG
jgi:hypothetical protein